MDIGGRTEGGFHIVDVIGKVDRLKDSMALRSYVTMLTERGITRIAINMADVTYLDSGALNVLIFCRNALETCGGRLFIISPNEYVSDVLTVVGFDRLIKIYSSEEEFLDDVKKA